MSEHPNYHYFFLSVNLIIFSVLFVEAMSIAGT